MAGNSLGSSGSCDLENTLPILAPILARPAEVSRWSLASPMLRGKQGAVGTWCFLPITLFPGAAT
jgi:hypothetical protein